MRSPLDVFAETMTPHLSWPKKGPPNTWGCPHGTLGPKIVRKHHHQQHQSQGHRPLPRADWPIGISSTDPEASSVIVGDAHFVIGTIVKSSKQISKYWTPPQQIIKLAIVMSFGEFVVGVCSLGK
jgi:hypothetical protein